MDMPVEAVLPAAQPNATGCAFPALVLMTYLILPVAGGLLGVITGIRTSIIFLLVPGGLAAWAGWVMADKPAWPTPLLRPRWIYVGILGCWTILLVSIAALLIDYLASPGGLGAVFILFALTPVMQFPLFRCGIRTKIAWASSCHRPIR
ncbi:hypothetical protein [Pseudoroseomonas sp. WGS1072]|uniref:hypothetical protein n=1 Tax=Roseomonas sp. WGS1072 TaxID=3366816 RepID=UPI003BF348B6